MEKIKVRVSEILSYFKEMEQYGDADEYEGIQYVNIGMINLMELLQDKGFILESIRDSIYDLFEIEKMYAEEYCNYNYTDEQYTLMENTKYDTVLLFSNGLQDANRQIFVITLTTEGERYDVSMTGLFYLDYTQTILIFTKDGWMHENTTAPTQQQSNSTNNEDLETRVNNIEEKLDTLIKMLSK